MSTASFFPRLLPCFFVLLAAALLTACGSGKNEAPKTRPALSITTAQPVVETWPIRISANGNIEAWQEAVVGSDVQALRLAEVRADVGDTVQAGQVLAVFDDEPVKIDVAQAQAALAQARAAVEAARLEHHRAYQRKYQRDWRQKRKAETPQPAAVAMAQ